MSVLSQQIEKEIIMQEYSYCDAIDIEPNDEEKIGWNVNCSLYDFSIKAPGDCCTCKLRKRGVAD